MDKFQFNAAWKSIVFWVVMIFCLLDELKVAMFILLPVNDFVEWLQKFMYMLSG